MKLNWFSRLFILILFFPVFSCGKQIPVESKIIENGISTLVESYRKLNNEPISRLDTIAFETEILRVIDGDTAEILYHDLFMRLRLAHIDAPETRGNQPFGKASGRYLRKLIEGQKVVIVSQRKTDGFGRLIATIYTEDGININKLMVEEGYAWHYKDFSNDMSYDTLQNRARKNKKGLWKDPNPIEPWNFRKK